MLRAWFDPNGKVGVFLPTRADTQLLCCHATLHRPSIWSGRGTLELRLGGAPGGQTPPLHDHYCACSSGRGRCFGSPGIITSPKSNEAETGGQYGEHDKLTVRCPQPASHYHVTFSNLVGRPQNLTPQGMNCILRIPAAQNGSKGRRRDTVVTSGPSRYIRKKPGTRPGSVDP